VDAARIRIGDRHSSERSSFRSFPVESSTVWMIERPLCAGQSNSICLCCCCCCCCYSSQHSSQLIVLSADTPPAEHCTQSAHGYICIWRLCRKQFNMSLHISVVYSHKFVFIGFRKMSFNHSQHELSRLCTSVICASLNGL